MLRLIYALLSAGSISISIAAAASQPWMAEAVDNLKKEKKISEVLFANDSPTSLWISVKDDGSRRDGYAEYACLVLHQSGMPKGQFTVVHVWDAAAMARGEQEELGRYECESS